MNRYMAGIFGVEPGDAIGRTTSELMSRYGAEKTDENDKRVLAAGKELGFYEEEYKDSSGQMRQWLVNKLPILDAAGEIENIVTVALDIGERKRVEFEMRKAKDAAEAALRNLRETQNSLIEAEKLAALGRLVAGVAHEVNNPVGISLTVASALERKTANFRAEVARGELRRSALNDFLETSRDASSQLVANLNRAAELIQSFKQVAADRNYSDQRSFDLGDLTEQVVMSLRPGLRKHNLTLNVDCQPNLMMNSYPGPYGQVLTNLFLNSVAHAFPDGKPGTVDIQVRESGKNNVEVIFSDNGCGMSLDVRRRAFDPFFTTRRDQGGTGLGLHIVYSIVTNRLGGRLDLEFRTGRRHTHPDDPAAHGAARAGGGIGERRRPLIRIRQLVQRCAEDLAGFADKGRAVHGAARISEGAGDADADGIGSAEQRIGVLAGSGVTLHQHLALEAVALHGVAAGVEQIGVAAEDLTVPEQNHAAALAGAPIQQGDVDRIQPVLHDVPMPAAAPAEAGEELCQSAAHSVNASGCPQIPRTGSKSRACHFGAVETEASWPAKCIVLVGTGRRVLEQEKQVINWINSGGHVPRCYIENNNCETDRPASSHRPLENTAGDRWYAAGVAAGFRSRPGPRPRRPLRQFTAEAMVRQSAERQGPCCSDADGSAVSDVDWESKGGRYRVRIEGEWHEVPEDAVITEPNRVGRTMVWPIKGYLGLSIRCFMPGSMT